MKENFQIVLVGNANVGKSALFNHLTGSEQTLGNWPGKTVQKAEGKLLYQGKTITILDLPGIYSFSTYSGEESISRDYITASKPDVIVNVVDATFLERNLFLTLQLLEMDLPMVVVLNLTDIAEKKGIQTNLKKMQKLLGVPVIATVATQGKGVEQIIEKAISVAEKKTARPSSIHYGMEIENAVETIAGLLSSLAFPYPLRWSALQLLEVDSEITKAVKAKRPSILDEITPLCEKMTQKHDQSCSIVITDRRYTVAERIARECQTAAKKSIVSWSDRLDAWTMHGILGYVVLFVVMISILVFISLFGGWVDETMNALFESVKPQTQGFWQELLWSGAFVGLISGLVVAFGFILPFYLILGFLEDLGYLPKIAYLMDRPCHMIGLHGKASMPLLLAFGCNVLACEGCRIMETPRDKFIATFLSTLIPCSARTSVILGMVGAYVGVHWAIFLYALDFTLILILGILLNKMMPGNSVGLIMEIPLYRSPSWRMIIKQVWSRFRPFLLQVIPLIIAGSIAIEALRLADLLETVARSLNPITVWWLGLPSFTGVILIFGILRKEAALALLATIAGTSDIATILTPIQMVVFCFVLMIYIPCLATVAALVKETGWKNALLITLLEIALAFVLGGLLFRALTFVM